MKNILKKEQKNQKMNVMHQKKHLQEEDLIKFNKLDNEELMQRIEKILKKKLKNQNNN